MNCIIIFSFILTVVEIYLSTATEILYVLPDNSTNVTCPSQPCATLSQYTLDNGTLPVVSNVEYHFLPGEHHVPANMTLQNLHNLSIIGTNIITTSSPVMLVGCLQSHVFNIINSHYVTISNVMFKHCGGLNTKFTNLKVTCCFSCRIENVTFLQYGFTRINLVGNTYLDNIKIDIMQSSEMCCQKILLQYNTCPLWSRHNNHMHDVKLMINKLLINDHMYITHNYDNSA